MKKIVKFTLTVSFKDDFIPFLESNQACRDYIDSALARHRGENTKDEELLDIIYRKLQSVSPRSWISGMFTWCQTPRGQKFWSSIDSLWRMLLRIEAGVEDFDFEEFGEISKSDVEEIFFLEHLRGQYYKVTDLSYNRPVTKEWDREKWDICKNSVLLNKAGGIYLVLSDYPEDKVMLWYNWPSIPKPMIKVWVPELDQAQWVFYDKKNLRKTK